MLDDVQHQVTPTNFVSESTVEPGSTADDAQYQVTPSSSVSEGAVGEFSIYLVKQEVSLEQMVGANLSKLELEDTPIVSVDDVVAYTWETHEIELTDSACERITRLEGLILKEGGLSFVICVGREPIYGGAFWTSYSSAVFGGILIDVYPAEFGQPVPIQLGYPSPEWFAGEDLRSDPKIFQSLVKVGKLM